MLTEKELKENIQHLDGEGYKAYKGITGEYDFGDYVLFIDSVQRDPFASPSKLRVRIYEDKAAFPLDSYSNISREVALRDYLTRRFHENTELYSLGNRGSGNSGLIRIDKPEQEILERTSVVITHLYVEARFTAGLPAIGRTVAAKHAEAMLFDELPKIVNHSLRFENLNEAQLYDHIHTAEDADFIRGELENLGLVAFVADKSLLPRMSGVDDSPLPEEEAVLFESPVEIREDLFLPNTGLISGMGISKGVTLITGGGYHGKSTLLRAIERGVYNHIPGDGREFVVTNPNAVKIRAEGGRSVQRVNITPFISKLPFGKETDSFSTDNASGSTSQAANILEALEIGADVLLIDEDTTATNFMIRDHRMQELVSKRNEPINPFIDKVRSLYRDHRVSTLLVVGGSGDYFDVADRVIRMTEYKAEEVTEEAKEIAERFETGRVSEGGDFFGILTERIPVKDSINSSYGKRKARVSHKGLHSITFGKNLIDLGAVEQIVDSSQTNAIGDAIEYSKRYMDGVKTLREITSIVMMDIARSGLDVLKKKVVGDHAEFRKLELAAAINRLRTLQVEQKK
jgi:predicted ABC-class ATPase